MKCNNLYGKSRPGGDVKDDDDPDPTAFDLNRRSPPPPDCFPRPRANSCDAAWLRPLTDSTIHRRRARSEATEATTEALDETRKGDQPAPAPLKGP